ncbi:MULTISPECIES: YaeQ family protein [unclassified Agarivorans]|uniref:YaeQ family protein n=1 Tax=unclassified Agarivorans TaxID=2636026 RepID=UPI0026E3BFD3|nr:MULTISPECIES: YaeQ family protein [unclassified Agarivorans]MDO6685879.1 YaeQ family protein [Agarivorans sp. 3_MG-2023]MDO6713983.1 YaeQ family protein [Agarivorans sp. 2_MG-2023]MDO6762314.1 YaeQ family protein [Agarivorans sp. 1_MG-2023]
MALKPTIYKLRISLSDLNRNYYDTLNLTIAQHPSETLERMMARTMAFCHSAEQGLEFTKGLSEIEEPDIWLKSLENDTKVWVDVGEPTPERMKKASRSAELAKVYTFNAKSDTWWQQTENKVNQLSIQVWQFDWQEISTLASFVKRTMDLSVTITEESAYVTSDDNEIEIHWRSLK